MDDPTQPQSLQSEWTPSEDGKSVTYVGKKYLSAKIPHAFGLTTRQVINLKQGMMPNNDIADVIQDLQTRAIY